MIDLKKICVILEKNKCNQHNENPKATVEGKSIKLITCCEKFQVEIEKKLEIEIEKQIDKNINDMLEDL